MGPVAASREIYWPFLQRPPCPLHAKRAGPCRHDRQARRLRRHRHRVCQDDAEAARTQWRKVADQLRPKLPKLAGFLDEAETMCWSIWPSHRSTGPNCTRPTRSSALTARSSGAPRWSASSRTKMPSSASSARSCSSGTMNGPSNAP